MTKIELALNLAGFNQFSPYWTDKQITPRLIEEHLVKKLVAAGIEETDFSLRRVYIGNEFCSRYLSRNLDMDSFIGQIEGIGLDVTLVLPKIQESHLDRVIEFVNKFSDTDSRGREIACNDLGMLRYISTTHPGIPLIAGRLFCRPSRDPRVDLLKRPDFRNNMDVLQDSGLFSDEFRNVFAQLGVTRFEFEVLDTGVPLRGSNGNDEISVHYPWVYLTSGNVCSLGSASLALEKKFKLTQECAMECKRFVGAVEHDVLQQKVYQYGNTYVLKPSRGNIILNELLADRPCRLVVSEFLL